MKKFLLLSVCTLMLFGCKKKETDQTKNSSITISGLSDITLKNDEIKTVNIEITNTSESNDVISLSAEGLPKGLDFTFAPNSGSKKFNSIIALSLTDSATSGTYPIKVIATTTSGGKKEFPINITLEVTKFNFTVNGLINPTINDFGSTSFNIEVKQTGSIQENVSLSAEDLPPGISVNFSPKSGITTFSSTISFDNLSNAQSGVYPIKIVATNSAGLKKSYTINLTLNISCIYSLQGSFSLVETVDGVAKAAEDVGMGKAGPGYIYIYDYKNYHFMTFDCDAKTINLFEQDYKYPNGGGTISGIGTFTNTTITVEGTFQESSSASVKTFKRVYTRQ